METDDVMIIRPIGPDAWRDWRTVRLQALLDAPDAFGTSYAEAAGPKDHESYWRGYFVANGQNYLAYLGQGAVGLVRVVGPEDGSAAELMSLWVAPMARGHGVGAALVNQCWAWLQHVAPGSSLQLSVRRHNHAALHLYADLGFTFTGAAPEDPREDVLIKRHTA